MKSEEATEIRRKLENMLSSLDSLLNIYREYMEEDWHGYAGDAAASLRASLESPIPARKQ